jgi:toxin ParE1/3/4
MKLRWSLDAMRHRAEIWRYIATDNRAAADEIEQRFEQVATLLLETPKIGKPGRVSRTREFIVHENYRLIYEIKGGIIFIITVIHAARLWPPLDND